MRLSWALIAAAILCASPARAERLQFDHRLYPPLQQVLDSGSKDMIDFNAKNPARLVDLIAVKGKSAKSWTEALEIVSIVRPGDVAGADGWMALLQQQALTRCKAEFTVIAQDTASVTFERRSKDCKTERANHGIYRLVAGKRSWFQLTVLSKEELPAEARSQWLALLASARLE